MSGHVGNVPVAGSGNLLTHWKWNLDWAVGVLFAAVCVLGGCGEGGELVDLDLDVK